MVVFVGHEQEHINSAAPGIPHLGADPVFLKHPGHSMFTDSRRHGGSDGAAGGDKGGDKDCNGATAEDSSPAARNANDNVDDGGQRGNPTVNGFSAALSCYPVVVQIARSVDLNTLDSLAMTCLQFRANLLPYRSQLVRETLRCGNEPLDDVPSEDGDSSDSSAAPGLVSGDPPDIFQAFPLLDTTAGGTAPVRYWGFPRLTTRKVGRCARDMVAECQRCMYIVCRNCTMKQIGASSLRSRLRRLCSTCRTAPLSDHFLPSVPSQHDSHDHNTHYRSHALSQSRTRTFTNNIFGSKACHCEESIWLCQPCGQLLSSDDTTYQRVWTWRTRYSPYLSGGLRTGMGEGWQGVKCGRGERCLAAEEIEMEVDCDVDDWMSDDSEHYRHQHNNNHRLGSNNGGYDNCHLPPQHGDGHGGGEPGYLRQEIEGVGGVVKQKVKKRVRVGACVEEHEDEKGSESYLMREYLGEVRSWCGWCERVVPSIKEREGLSSE
ncbi:hypothetical protein BDBG_04934 [Blastomyces gilchristii SLH14081]|uniref:Uncharacterized protein n=1 Tax=Blastomyces gilchristii (strain SLH14081) TaxID=559298 RepID=A0A179UKW0_BLAGS|nr:uncharacterized protein BDBG_04934 [Blastomyces gilchristii SLH14081]OAT08695.1 hypothetical protein BDBG_04934 [Blastomyces gilchristii SLH14081]